MSRVPSSYVSLGSKTEGEIDCYLRPENDAVNWLLHLALASDTVTSTGATATAYTHVFSEGNYGRTCTSLSANARYGDLTNGIIKTYNGLKVNELKFSCDLKDAVRLNFGMVGMADATGASVATNLTYPAQEVLTFVSGRFSIESTTTAFTTTSYWEVSKVDFALSNSLKPDDGRAIGSMGPVRIPYGEMKISLNAEMKFTTTTAYDAMMAGTELRGQLFFEGSTISGTAVRRSVLFEFGKVQVKEGSVPEIGGPDDLLKSKVSFDVLRNIAAGYAIKATVVNGTESY
jgi:hypothetical protein